MKASSYGIVVCKEEIYGNICMNSPCSITSLAFMLEVPSAMPFHQGQQPMSSATPFVWAPSHTADLQVGR